MDRPHQDTQCLEFCGTQGTRIVYVSTHDARSIPRLDHITGYGESGRPRKDTLLVGICLYT